ncbi:hypothetical protein FRC10_001380 [Ceratobasidium sp. 414]|nr:hypothetical protein FRC10_001380 [Ceratobasidium sp. 414]
MPTPSLVALGNKILGSFFNHRNLDPHRIGYPRGWRTGDTEAWYKSQPTTKFTHLQYRKEREAPFYNEYIVVELDNNTVCRFDRRSDVTTRAAAFTSQGITAEDTAQVIQKHETYYDDINNKSDIVLRIHFPNGQDLLTILGICYGVQKDDETRAYTLTRYNCYFFTWMIITATARRTVDWALLCKETDKWEELVRTTMEGLNSDSPSLRSRSKDGTRTVFGLGRKGSSGPPSGPGAIPFVGATYLINTLHQALLSSRSSIQQRLEQLLFQTTIESSIRQISDDFAKKAAAKACRNYASQVALDAAMGLVVESMWATVLYTDNGREVWHNRCLLTEGVVQIAASAAAEADEQDEYAAKSGPLDWEQAWDAVWSEKWAEMTNGQSRFNRCFGTSDGENMSTLVKEAWINAWYDACEASEKYVSLLSNGVAEYVAKNLPDSLPEVLKIVMGVSIHAFYWVM